MQRSAHPSGLVAGLAEIDPPFLWPGEGVAIALTVVGASRSPVSRSRLSRAPGDLPRVACAWQARMTGPCRRFPVVHKRPPVGVCPGVDRADTPDFMPGWKCALCEDVAGDPAEGCVPVRLIHPHDPLCRSVRRRNVRHQRRSDLRSSHKNDHGATVTRARRAVRGRIPPGAVDVLPLLRRLRFGRRFRMSRSPLSAGRVLGALESLRLHPCFRGGKTRLSNDFSEFGNIKWF
jgi:hypothetical protein